VRRIEAIFVWGRSSEKARALAARLSEELGIAVNAAASVEEAVRDADVVCTVSAASEPILRGAWVRPGTHVNVVGSSYAGPVEVDDDLVVRSRFIADYRKGILEQGAELLRARAAGLVDDDHVVAEIGQVLLGEAAGRRTREEITVYKSIGHVVQDLATAWALHEGSDHLE